MAVQIRMSPDQIHERANQYRVQAENVDMVITRMDTLLQELQGEWEGAASEAYAERFIELRPGFIKARELITEIAAFLDNAAGKIAEADMSIAGAMLKS